MEGGTCFTIHLNSGNQQSPDPNNLLYADYLQELRNGEEAATFAFDDFPDMVLADAAGDDDNLTQPRIVAAEDDHCVVSDAEDAGEHSDGDGTQLDYLASLLLKGDELAASKQSVLQTLRQSLLVDDEDDRVFGSQETIASSSGRLGNSSFFDINGFQFSRQARGGKPIQIGSAWQSRIQGRNQPIAGRIVHADPMALQGASMVPPESPSLSSTSSDNDFDDTNEAEVEEAIASASPQDRLPAMTATQIPTESCLEQPPGDDGFVDLGTISDIQETTPSARHMATVSPSPESSSALASLENLTLEQLRQEANRVTKYSVEPKVPGDFAPPIDAAKPPAKGLADDESLQRRRRRRDEMRHMSDAEREGLFAQKQRNEEHDMLLKATSDLIGRTDGPKTESAVAPDAFGVLPLGDPPATATQPPQRTSKAANKDSKHAWIEADPDRLAEYQDALASVLSQYQ